MAHPLYFDYAATTPCCEEAIARMAPFASESFGHPSSSHAYGQKAAAAIREARRFFADQFGIEAEQVIFTGSGTESDNLAISGLALSRLKGQQPPTSTVLYSAIEHSAVSKTAASLEDFGFSAKSIPVTLEGHINDVRFRELLDEKTKLVSIHLVNNIIGTLLPIESLAKTVKTLAPNACFHTDAVQAFGRVEVPKIGSCVDMVSISSHKIEGPKGVGALIILKKELLKILRPLIFGGGQEAGLRSGTQNAGLIAGFHAAAQLTLSKRSRYTEHTKSLRQELRKQFIARGLLNPDSPKNSRIHWNSPDTAVSHIVNVSFPGLQAGAMARLLEERNCLVSTGSACSASKPQPDPVLAAIGAPSSLQTSAIRFSFSDKTVLSEIEVLGQAVQDSIERAAQLSGRPQKERKQ